MAKRAALFGCNYPGTEAALNGCVNDVYSMRDLLIRHKGFQAENIEIYIDTDPSAKQPTGANMKAAIRSAIAASVPGDVVFFHFSGHGTQIPHYDGEEEDGKDEAIVPTDMNLISDGDLKCLVAGLADGVELTFVTDCCHSGSMLDHEAVQIEGSKDGSTSAGGDEGLVAMFAGLSGRGFEQEDVKNREMPLSMLTSILSQRTNRDVNPTNLSSVLADTFKGSASLLFGGVMSQANLLANNTTQRALGVFAPFRALFSMCSAGHTVAENPNTGDPADYTHTAGANAGKVTDDKGILITGCQAHETSADACPSGDKSKAFGALSNAITTCVDKEPDLTFYDLVVKVRAHLGANGFKQNPCLECSSHNAHKPFVC
eukprot:m.17049 g.17049  ORF g.17049 m.17049 type:complete len:373 (-) comp3563_c0_seq1:140-1258(-)